MGNVQTIDELRLRSDPCAQPLQDYLKCVKDVEATEGGLRDGNDCSKETAIYKECRNQVKNKTNKK